MTDSANDLAQSFRETVEQALADKSPLKIIGGNSKAFYGRESAGEPLCVNGHCGIVNYHPSELVVTARTGTLLTELKKTLAGQDQMLAFEPPGFAETATLGGTVACGFSGSRRLFTGSARDFMLGCKIINGKAEILSFGGEVIKNVAGYDISRLMAGSLGTLGLILEVSLKVLPLPRTEMTCCFELSTVAAIERMKELAGRSLPVSGLSYDGSIVYVRLSGAEKTVTAAAAKIGGDPLNFDGDYWRHLNEHQLEFFRTEMNLWRLCLPPATGPLELEGDWQYDWGGGLRWLKSDEPAERVFSVAEQFQGHAVLFKGKNRNGEIFQPLTGTLKQLNFNVKKAFDPEGIFNPNRMYKDW